MTWKYQLKTEVIIKVSMKSKWILFTVLMLVPGLIARECFIGAHYSKEIGIFNQNEITSSETTVLFR